MSREVNYRTNDKINRAKVVSDSVGGGLPIVYTPVSKTGQFTTEDDFDNGWHEQLAAYDETSVSGIKTRLADKYTLVDNNVFGNKFRYTNDLGNQTTDGSDGATVGYIIDHYRGKGLYFVKTIATYYSFLTMSNTLTVGAYSNFRGVNDNEVRDLTDLGNGNPEALKEAVDTIFNVTTGITRYWSICGLEVDQTYAWAWTKEGQNVNRLKTVTEYCIFIRNHF
jgi:hypothetical protein